MEVEREEVPLEIDLGALPEESQSDRISTITGLQSLLERRELCDVALVVPENSAGPSAGPAHIFPAHRAVLAAASSKFHEALSKLEPCGRHSEVEGLPKLWLEGISSPGAVPHLLQSVYGGGPWRSRETPGEANREWYEPLSDAENRDVLLLARRFGLPQLEAKALRYLHRGLNTANVLERLTLCEEFGLTTAKERILQQLTANPEALYALTRDERAVRAPTVLQEMLLRVLRLLGCGSKVDSLQEAGVNAEGAFKAGA